MRGTQEESQQLKTAAEATISDAPAAGPSRLSLALEVTDPEVVAHLREVPEGEERQRYALAALRLGVLSMRMASGQLDAATIREAGQKLVADVRELLSSRTAELTGSLTSALKQYFDPASGALPQRLHALVAKDGELERVLRAHVGPEESLLSRSLATHLGEGSPVLRLLSPTEAGGLRAQIQKALEKELSDQRERVLREFSLDNKESALSRLVGEISEGNGQLRADLKGQIDAVVKEFSLDQPDSALSRLVSRVDAAQKAIADQFSSDNDQSALSRLSRLLKNTSDQIDKNLTLDSEDSALSRLKRALDTTIAELTQKNASFHAEVRETLAKLQTRREEEARTTRHGTTFEQRLGALLTVEAQRLGDVHEEVGLTVGSIRHCKVGDHVVQLSRDSAAPDARVVWESKEEHRYGLKQALAEIDLARKNRDGQVGVFVFSRKTAPAELEPFSRYDRDLVVIWDAEDQASDVYIRAAYSVARALALRARGESVETRKALREIDEAALAIGKQIKFFDDFRTWGEDMKKNGDKLVDRSEKMKKELERQLEHLHVHLDSLKTSAEETP